MSRWPVTACLDSAGSIVGGIATARPDAPLLQLTVLPRHHSQGGIGCMPAAAAARRGGSPLAEAEPRGGHDRPESHDEDEADQDEHAPAPVRVLVPELVQNIRRDRRLHRSEEPWSGAGLQAGRLRNSGLCSCSRDSHAAMHRLPRPLCGSSRMQSHDVAHSTGRAAASPGTNPRGGEEMEVKGVTGSAPHRAAGVERHDHVGEVAQLRHRDAVHRPRHCTRMRHSRASEHGACVRSVWAGAANRGAFRPASTKGTVVIPRCDPSGCQHCHFRLQSALAVLCSHGTEQCSRGDDVTAVGAGSAAGGQSGLCDCVTGRGPRWARPQPTVTHQDINSRTKSTSPGCWAW